MQALAPPKVHRTAVVSPEAELAPGVRVGARCVVEGRVRLGPLCVLAPGCHLIGPLTAGAGNRFGPGSVLGGPPQHAGFEGEPAGLEVGHGNAFGQEVTAHRGTTAAGTRIGSGNVFLPRSHVGHDCHVGSGGVYGRRALLGGHCAAGDGVRLGARAAVHQFGRLGRYCRLAPGSTASKDVPPFALHEGRNAVRGACEEALGRLRLPPAEAEAVRQAFRIIYGLGLSFPGAVALVERDLGWCAAVGELVGFIRSPGRGVCGPGRRPRAPRLTKV
jgi:UDP-N-acetylglucosamine acyltransferase